MIFVKQKYIISLQEKHMKKRISIKQEPTVEIFSALTNMKFQPKSIKASEELMKNLQKNEQKSAKQMSQISFVGRKLTFIIQLMQYHFLIGNENQLDMVSVGGRINEFVDTQYFWSLNINSPILQVQIDPKKSLIVIYSQLKLLVYTFNHKRKHQTPHLVITQQVTSEVKFLRFPKELQLVVFYDKNFQIYSFDETATEMKRTTSKKYGIKDNFAILDVPPSTQNFINVFFQEPKKSQSFGLWCVNIAFDLIKTRVGTVFKIYDIMKKFKRNLQIKNYSKDVIFINLGTEVIAAKKGYIIDAVNVNIQTQNSNLKYVGNQKLLHITNKRVEVYSFKVNTTNVPNRVHLKATDSLQLGQTPQNSIFVGASMNKDNNITVFFQNMEVNHSNGQIQYWFKTSYTIDRQSKVKKIFNYGKQISQLDSQLLESKYDIAEKMGLSKKDIYLEIWNRSGKSNVEDYKFLLATNHYKTIRAEIENKLRKHTMSFRELVKIEKSCYEMLHNKVYSMKQKCSEQNLQDFLTSHMYLKKLNLFKQISTQKKQKKSLQQSNPQMQSVLTIDIQQYSIYKQFQLKQFILDEVSEFCFRDKHHKIDQIRLVFNEFRFIIRMFYKEILSGIVHTAKLGLLKLLNAIPEILPYQHIMTKQENPLMFSGVWSDIAKDQWQSNLYIDNITTIENKQLIEEFVQSIWFKRNQLIYHVLVPKHKEQIIQINKTLNSQTFFYLFLSQVFQNYKKGVYDFCYITEIINYLQTNFQLFPEHLKSNVLLYFQLYQYYAKQQEWKLPKMNLQKFFTLKDYQLFRYFFDLEKIKKNCILKEIKPIYSKLHVSGNQIFNEGLLSYFDSQVSELSDLKYLLNRINNEKAQFHEQNLKMYQILLKAMEMKIRIGTGHQKDATISEVLVYVESIPPALLKNNQNKHFIDQLKIIKNIQKHQKILQQMNLNMTLQYMLKRCEDVILKMVDFEIEDKKLFSSKDYTQFKNISILILDQIKKIKDNIYGQIYPSLALFAFSTTVLEKENLILYLAKLFEQQEIKKIFTVDLNLRENLVIYSYKWKFSQQTMFFYNQSYLRKLFELLPEGNNTRVFLESELRLALIFSQKEQKLEYPISVNYVVPKAFQIEEIVQYLSKQYISCIDFDEIFNILNKMYLISKGNDKQERPYITRQKIYEIFIERLLQQPNSAKQVFILFRKYLAVKNQNKGKQDEYECLDQLSAYISIFYDRIHKELNDQSREKLTQILSLLYKQPQHLIQILQHLLLQKRTGLQMIKYLNIKLQQVNKRDLLSFDPKNSLIQTKLVSCTFSQSKIQNSILNKIVRNSLQNMKAQREIFKVNQIYNIIFITLCHSPLNCLTILRFYKQKIKYKELRNYISYLSQEIIFQQNQVIQCFVILFDVLLKNFKYNLEFQSILKDVYFKDQAGNRDIYQIFREIHQIEVFEVPQEDYYKKLFKSLKRFLRKRNALASLKKSRRKNFNRTEQIQLLLQNQVDIDNSKKSRAKRKQNIYPFSDSDFAEDDEHNPAPPKILRRRRKFLKIDFDCENQRLKMLRRSDQDLTQYLVNTLQVAFISPNGNNQSDNRSDKGSVVSTPGRHKLKITQRKKSVERDKLKEVHQQQKNKYRVNRMLGIDSIPTQYITSHNNASFIEPATPLYNKKANFFDIATSNNQQFFEQYSRRRKGSFGQQNNSIFKHPSKSNNTVKQCSTHTVNEMKLILLNSCQATQTQNTSIKIFNLKPLMKFKEECFFEEDAKFSNYIRDLIKSIYEDSQSWADGDKLSLINQIVKKYHNLTKYINKRMLEIYIRLSTLKKSYQVSIDATKLFGFEGLLLQATDSSQILYNTFQENILNVMNDENAIKISRLMALTLRKNYLQQQLTYAYLIKKLKLIGQAKNKMSLEQKQELILRKIIFSLSIKRFVDSFDEILSVVSLYNNQSSSIKEINKKIIGLIIQSVQTKGDYRSQEDLRRRYKAIQSINRQNSDSVELKIQVTEKGKSTQ